MKFLTFISCLLMTSFAYAKIERPEKSETGYKNVNNRKEYKFSTYPSEEIWHEFGRPFWRAKKVTKMPLAKPAAMVAKKVAKVEANKIKEKVKIDLGVYFASSESIFEKDYFNQLDQIGLKLKNNNNIKLELRGHIDNTGSRVLNELLSNERSNYLWRIIPLKMERKRTEELMGKLF